MLFALMLGVAPAVLAHGGSSRAPLQLEPGQRQLMIDDSLLDTDDAAQAAGTAPVVRMHPAQKTGQVSIVADKPWEGVIFYYDSIVQVSDDEFRIYYDTFGPKGRFLCVAVSNDTLTWTKPALHNVAFENSTVNNIILGASGYIEPGTVFVDTNPAVQPHEKFKMVASSGGGATMFSSPDGFKFSPMTPKPSLTGSDTQDVVFFDERYNQYVYYGRTHERGGPPCPAGTQQAGRSIGRMLLGTNVSSWPVASADKVPTIFNVDADDAPCMDVYCNAATPYAGIYLMFPLMFKHFAGAANDGLLEARLVASRDGANFSYIGANGRDAFLPRGMGAHRPGYVGIFSGEFDSAATAMARGLFEVGDRIVRLIHLCTRFEYTCLAMVMFGYGSQYTHGGYAGFLAPGGPILSGLQRLEMRKDGFGSLSSPNSTAISTARTVPLRVPPTCGGTEGQSLHLRVNVQTSVGGYLSIALAYAENRSAVTGFGRSDAQPFIGNFISAIAEWGHPTPPAPAPKPPTTCTYEEPGGQKCTDGYIPMTCEEAKRRSTQGCMAHACHGKPTQCQPDGTCASLNGTKGNTLCVLSGPPPPPPPPPVPLRSDLSALGGASLSLQLEGRDFNLFSFVFVCEDRDDA